MSTATHGALRGSIRGLTENCERKMSSKVGHTQDAHQVLRGKEVIGTLTLSLEQQSNLRTTRKQSTHWLCAWYADCV